MKFVAIFEPAHSDGYKSIGDGTYHLDANEARAIARQKHGAYSRTPIEYVAATDDNKNFYILAGNPPKPVHLANSAEAQEQIKKVALDKLTPEERSVLGL